MIILDDKKELKYYDSEEEESNGQSCYCKKNSKRKHSRGRVEVEKEIIASHILFHFIIFLQTWPLGHSTQEQLN